MQNKQTTKKVPLFSNFYDSFFAWRVCMRLYFVWKIDVRLWLYFQAVSHLAQHNLLSNPDCLPWFIVLLFFHLSDLSTKTWGLIHYPWSKTMLLNLLSIIKYVQTFGRLASHYYHFILEWPSRRTLWSFYEVLKIITFWLMLC